MSDWTLDSSDGHLLVTTGVTGPAAKMGHRLTIGFEWQAAVEWDAERPVAVELTVDVGSLEVRRGEGGVSGLTAPEKALARANALKTLDAKKFPVIRYRADEVTATDDGYRLSGTLEIHGRSRDQVVDVRAEQDADEWQVSCAATVSHTAFGVKPYSMMMGAMKVADEVEVSFTARGPGHGASRTAR